MGEKEKGRGVSVGDAVFIRVVMGCNKGRDATLRGAAGIQ